MEEIEEYLSKLALDVKEYKFTEKDNLKVAKRCFEHAQLLTNVGKQRESLEFFEVAWKHLRQAYDEDLYKNLFEITGLLYASVLDYLNEIPACERIFQELNEKIPDGFHLGDYAYFLHRRKRDFDNAERCYQRAIKNYPTSSSIRLKYAGFLRHVRKNIEGAEIEYQKSIEENPKNADALGNYASFLHGVKKNASEAEKFYKTAVELDDTHSNNLCNYGLFLSEEKSNFDLAERMYKRVLQINPNHSNTVYNYAVLLDTHMKRKTEAEQYYRLTLTLEPKHAYALYNLGVLLEEKYFSQKDMTEVDKKNVEEVAYLYRRAAECDARDSNTIADYGRFLFLRGENPLQAEPIFITTLKNNPKCEIALYYLALLYYKEKKSPEKAEQLLNELLKIAPQHANGNITYARILMEKLKSTPPEVRSVEKIVSHYELAFQSSKEIEPVILEILKFIREYGQPDQKKAVLSLVGPTLNKLQRQDSIQKNAEMIATSLQIVDDIKRSL